MASRFPTVFDQDEIVTIANETAAAQAAVAEGYLNAVRLSSQFAREAAAIDPLMAPPPDALARFNAALPDAVREILLQLAESAAQEINASLLTREHAPQPVLTLVPMTIKEWWDSPPGSAKLSDGRIVDRKSLPPELA